MKRLHKMKDFHGLFAAFSFLKKQVAHAFRTEPYFY